MSIKKSQNAPRWNGIALAHIESCNNLPVINFCRWWPYYAFCGLNDWNMEIKIAKDYVNYFGLDSWNHLTYDQISESENVRKFCIYIKPISVETLQIQTILLGARLTGVHEPWMRSRTALLFARCSRIESFELDFIRSDEFKPLSDAMGRTVIEKLVIIHGGKVLNRLE